ncbi:MAG: competence protein ComEA [Arcticibacterium sp.]
MKSFIQFIKRHFELNRHEALSVISGLGFAIIIVVVVWLYDSYTSQKEANLIFSEYNNLDTTLEQLKAKKRATFQRQKVSKKSNNNQKTELNQNLFNPNTATLNKLLENGIPSYPAKNLINFRDKGKVYKSKEELLSVYGMTENIYTLIEPYIDLPSKEDETIYSTFERVYEDTHTVRKKYKVPDIIPFDLNLATEEELMQVRGIGVFFAGKIIQLRKDLGGFYKVEQAKNTWKLSDSTYQELLKVAFIQTEPKKIKINFINEEEWKTRLIKYNQKRAIFAYRKQHGFYKDQTDLEKIKILNKDDVELLRHYIDFEIPE